MPGRCSAWSEHCHRSKGIAAAKCTACWPVPLPTSSTWREPAKCSRSTARIGSRLRSQAGAKGLSVIRILGACAGGGGGDATRSAGPAGPGDKEALPARRSEEHTHELQSLMRIPYAVFCLKKKKQRQQSRYVRHRQCNAVKTRH